MLFQNLKIDFARQLDDPTFRVENKLRLNLSDKAYAILLHDVEVFRVEKSNAHKKVAVPSSAINQIFSHFKGIAKSSITLTLNNEKLKYENMLASIQPESARKEAIQLILSDYQKKLIQETKRLCVKGNTLSFRLDLDNLRYLATEEGAKECEFYNDNVGQYVKTLLEEYSEQPYIEREYIWYKKCLKVVNDAIAETRILKLTLHGKKSNNIYLKPIKSERNSKSEVVHRDSELLYNYLAGMIAYDIDGPWEPGAIRLINIKKWTKMESRGSINRVEHKKIEEAISKNGVQFLSDSYTTQKIIVEFTPNGERQYKQLQHLRPKYTAIHSPYIYEFDCTLFQAEVYFFKFGHNVKILEPSFLADKFKRRYYSAFKQYNEE